MIPRTLRICFLTISTIISTASAFAVSRTRIPEEVVQYQLDALRTNNIAQAFEYNSESNQAVTGPWQSFATNLAEPAFRPILGHSESCVLMTICHDDSDYVCCLVKVVPSKKPLPESLTKIIAEIQKLEGLEGDNNSSKDDGDDQDEEDEKELPSCALYWWEVSKHYADDEEDYYYLVDSVLPDGEDLEMDYMETTLFAIGDEYDEDDDEEDPSSFFFDLGLN